MSTKGLLIFLFFSYFLIQNFLFSQCRVSYFPIFLSNHAAGHPVMVFTDKSSKTMKPLTETI